MTIFRDSTMTQHLPPAPLLSHSVPPPSPQRYAELHDMLFLEASAKNNHNVRECFLHLAREICELKAQQQPQTFPNADLTPSIKLKQSYPVERESQKEGGGGGGCSC